MSNSPDDLPQPLELPDDYPLAQDADSPRSDGLPPRLPSDTGQPPGDADEKQFSLSELLCLTAVVAALFSLLGSIAHWTPMGKSPAAFAALCAAVLGFVAVAGLVAFSFVPHARRILLVGLWALIGLYFVMVITALLLTRVE